MKLARYSSYKILHVTQITFNLNLNYKKNNTI